MFGGGKKGDSLWLFSLDGSIASLPAEASGTAAQAGGVEFPPGPGDRSMGQLAYRQFCLACHGEQGTGGQGGGASLANLARDPQMLANTAWNGKKAMPPFRGMLTPEQMRDLAAYIAADLFPGHPQ
jgi:mono/diheme cytochrome c family protein